MNNNGEQKFRDLVKYSPETEGEEKRREEKKRKRADSKKVNNGSSPPPAHPHKLVGSQKERERIA